MIRVLIVDDSAVVRDLLAFIMNADPGIEVVGAVHNGEQALEAVQQVGPDVVTMDIHMPRMNGFDATRQIMETSPVPIVIVSGSSSALEVSNTFNALEAGALAVVMRPPGVGHPGFETSTKELISTVKAMSEVKVVRRWPRERFATAAKPTQKVSVQLPVNVQIVAIGASTGGPVVLQTLLKRLPADFPVPIVIVQHMAAGFILGFTEWLTETCGRPVLVAGHGVHMQPGHVYVAPDHHHMGVDRLGRVTLSPCEADARLCPSAAFLFRSLAESYGAHAAGVLLTGMGNDGSAELKLLKDRGAVTFAQDEASSVIHGMPGEAIRLGGATHILPPDGIATTLAALVRSSDEGGIP